MKTLPDLGSRRHHGYPASLSSADHYVIACPPAPFDEPAVVLALTVRQRLAVERFAYYFRRELGFTFIQYSAAEGDAWDGHRAPDEDEGAVYLLRDLRGSYDHYVGAACFRWRVYADAPPGWACAWIWVHPFARRRGLVTAAWPGWVERHGRFLLEEPLSTAMQHFMKRPSMRGTSHWERRRKVVRRA